MNCYVNQNPFVIAQEIKKEFKIFNENLLIKKYRKDINELDLMINDLTQLKIQKILFLSYGYYYACTKQKLFDAKFEAWPYGPVIKEIYSHPKKIDKYNLDYLDDEYKKEKNKNLNWEIEKNKFNFKKIIRYFFMFSAWSLVDETHKFNCWKDAYNSNKPIEINKLHSEFLNIPDNNLAKFR